MVAGRDVQAALQVLKKVAKLINCEAKSTTGIRLLTSSHLPL
jgi:hypothetical protein